MFTLSLISLNANSLLKELPNSRGKLGKSLCNYIKSNAAIFCLTDTILQVRPKKILKNMTLLLNLLNGSLTMTIDHVLV